MSKHKRKLTAAEKAEKKLRRKEYMTVFINGKQKRVKRPQTIDGLDMDEFIRRKDGRTFALIPEKAVASPLNVPTIKAKITTTEIVDIVREGRER
jgi:hypothetical protein